MPPCLSWLLDLPRWRWVPLTLVLLLNGCSYYTQLLSGQVDLLLLVACRDARHLFEVDARILAVEGVERTDTSLIMGEVIPYRLGPLMEQVRREN